MDVLLLTSNGHIRNSRGGLLRCVQVHTETERSDKNHNRNNEKEIIFVQENSATTYSTSYARYTSAQPLITDKYLSINLYTQSLLCVTGMITVQT